MPLELFHLQRIRDAIDILKLKTGFELHEDFLSRTLLPDKLGNALVRMNFFRDGMGKYKPETNDLAFDFSHSPVEEEFYIPTALDLTTEMMRAPVRLGEIGLFEDPKPDHAVFTIKTLSSAYYVLAALAKTDLNCKYIFIQDTQGTILEELSSNVILRKGDQWISPYSNAGMVIGATLRYLKSAYGFQIQEKAFDYEEMKAADQIYLCRASTGIFRIR